MKGELSVQTSDPAEIVRGRIADYMKLRGYRVLDQASHLIFTRGSLWGSVTSFNPAKWKAKVSVHLRKLANGSTQASVTCFVNTTGQRVLQTEMDYWNAELDGLAQAIRTGMFDTTPAQYTERRAASYGKRAILTTIGGSILVSLLLTFLFACFILPLIHAATSRLTWEEILRTDTLTRQVEGILLPAFGGSFTRLIAAGALLAALFVGALQPLRKSTQNNLDELLQTLHPILLKPAHFVVDALVALTILATVIISFNLVNHAPPAEQQNLLYGITIGMFVIVIVAAMQHRRHKRQHPIRS